MLINTNKKLEDFDSNHVYRTAQVLLRISQIGNIVLGFTCLGLSLCLFALFPLKEIQPILIGFSDKEQKIVSIKTLNPLNTGLEACIEASARNFVRALETIDLNSHDLIRWKRLGEVWMGENLKENLGKRLEEANPDSPYHLAKEKKICRGLRILKSNIHPHSRKTVEVIWQVIERSAVTGRILNPPRGVKNIFRSILSFQETGGDWLIEDLEENPFRLKVSAYSVHSD